MLWDFLFGFCGKIENEQLIFPTLYDSDVYRFVFERNVRVSWRLQHNMRNYFKYDKTPLCKKIKWTIKKRFRNLFGFER